tara:strand:+ start:1356 stop:1664 length:309 start_codon:yes stop_codon:yes gene_type:complete
MLPHKIVELIRGLRENTESGIIRWNYDDENGSVSTSLNQPNIDISISYRFDTVEEVGTFRIDVYDKNTNSPLIFSTTQMYQDFEMVRALYDSAQASGYDFSF